MFHNHANNNKNQPNSFEQPRTAFNPAYFFPGLIPKTDKFSFK